MSEQVHANEQLAYYRDLTPAERRAVDAHLAQCARCRGQLEAYTRQDAALQAIPLLRPRGRWTPNEQQPRRWLGLLGDALVMGGLAALLWLFALQVQQLAAPSPVASPGTGGTPASTMVEPGLSIPPSTLRPPSPWLPALPWLGGALLAVGLLFILGRRNQWPALAGATLAALLLTSFVPPLSSFPNPAGVYWRLRGGYAYDPRLPFKNAFLIADQPEDHLRPYLDQLIGATGLSPLDPVQPLAGYEVQRVQLHPEHNRVALVFTRFIYADGSSRVYPVPVFGPRGDFGGFWLSDWQEDGLERLRSDHLALPGQPFATAAAPIRLGAARRIEGLSPRAHRLDEANPGHWRWDSVRVQRLVWARNGQAFLASVETDRGERQLWHVSLAGPEPTLIATGNILAYGWSPDGESVIYTRYDPQAAAVDRTRPYAIMAAGLEPGTGARQLVTGLSSEQLPGLTAQGAWFFSGGALWIVPYEGGQPQLVTAELGRLTLSGSPRPSPDGHELAFACGTDTCLLREPLASAGQPAPEPVRVKGLKLAEATWAADGQQLAVVHRDPNQLSPVRLVVVSTTGTLLLDVEIAPSDATEAPAWTPDGEVIFVQTYPHDGRRIIAVHVPTGQALDLSQERWDAYFALAPDGQSVLLNNGRGDFWIAEVIR